MNFRLFLLLLGIVIAAGAATVWLIAPGNADATTLALPALLIAVLAVRALSR